MPSRLYDQLDIQSPSNGWEGIIPADGSAEPPLNVLTPSISFSNPSNFEIHDDGNAGDVDPVTGANASTAPNSYFSRGILDFQRFPSIPTNALITEVVIRTIFSNSIQSDASASAGVPAPGVVQATVATGLVPATASQQSSLPIDDTQFGALPLVASIALSVTDEIQEDTYDAAYFFANFGSDKLNYNQFNAAFKNFELLLTIPSITAGAGGSGGIEPVTTTVAVSYTLSYSDWSMEVTYEESFQYELPVPPDPLAIGDPVTVTSDPNDPNAMDFEQILTVDLRYIDSNGDPQIVNVPQILWITITINLFVFNMPGFPDDAEWVDIIITSTQFVGSVTLGRLITINFTSATGIYRLDIGNTHDDLFLENDPPNTIGVKIPNPEFKSGFIGG